MTDDPFDPNTFTWPTEWRIYGNLDATLVAFVDEVDYHWAVQWQWSWKKSRKSRKLYIRRTMTLPHRWGSKSVYLHIEIMSRMGTVPPSDLHTIVGHRDGDSLNCRRVNLKWETPGTNFIPHPVGRSAIGRFTSCQ